MKNKMMNLLIFGVALIVLLTSSVTVVWAQANGAERQSFGGPEKFSDKELLAFAKSYVELDKIRGVSEIQMSAAKTPQEKSRIEQEAVARFSAALEREGLTMARFGVLYQTINGDDQLREMVLKLIEVEQNKS